MTMQPSPHHPHHPPTTPPDHPRAHAEPRAPLRPGASIATTLRVRYHECDPMGVAHHASYAPWLEMGRTDLLRASGVSYARLEREGVFLVIAKLELSYKRPVRYDDVVEVRTTWKGGGKVKIEHEYEVWVVERALDPLGAIRAHPHAPGSSELCATARTLLACVDREGRLRPLPEWLAV